MKISEEMVKEIILEVLQQNQRGSAAGNILQEDIPPLQLREIGEAKFGTNRNEVAIGVPPAFGTAYRITRFSKR